MKGSEKFALRMSLWRWGVFLCCCCSIAQLYPTLCNPMDCSMPGFPVLHHLSEFAQTHVTESVMPANQFILCHTLLLPSTFPRIGIFSNEPAFRIRWLEYWNFSFSFSISPTIGYSRLIPLTLAGFISLQSKGLSRVFPVPQFKSISSLVLSLLWVYPALTSICHHWKNHRFD